MSKRSTWRTTLRRWMSALVVVLLTAVTVRAQVEQRTYQRGNLILPAALLEKQIGRVKYEHANWKEVVEDVFRRAKVELVFDTQEGRVSDGTESLNLVSTRGTFAMLLRSLFGYPSSPDLYLDDKGVFHVIPPMKGGGLAGRPDLDTRKFTIVVEKNEVPVRTLLEHLFQEANVPYEIDPAVTGTKGINYREASFRMALIAMLRNIRGGPELTYRVENGKFFVYPKEREEKKSSSCRKSRGTSAKGFSKRNPYTVNNS